MKSVKLGLAGLVLVMAACATTVGSWHGESAKSDAKALRADVEASLTAESFSLQPGPEGLTAMKQGDKGAQTWMQFTFADASSGGSTFELVGKSNNRWNIASLGVMGFALRHRAWQACSEWYKSWQDSHPSGN